MIKRVIFLVVVAAALGAALWYSQQRGEADRISGFIEANEIRVGSLVGGRVSKVHVDEGAIVKPGQVLVELDPYDLLHQQAELKAQRAELQSNLDKLVAGPRAEDIEAAKGYVTVAEAQEQLAEITYRRVEKSYEAQAASPDEFDQAAENLKAAKGMVVVRKQELAALQNGTRPEDIAAAKAAVQKADASLAAIAKQIDELTIQAPVAGRIEAVELEPGDIVSPNAPVLSMIDPSTLWVRAYLPENMMRYHVGDKMTVTVDAYPDRKFAGHVTYISRDAEFTPGNVQTPEDRSKLVFRIKVTLDSGLDELRAGMAADVWLDRQPPADHADHAKPTPDTTQTKQPAQTNQTTQHDER